MLIYPELPFVHFISLAILKNLRTRLIESEFNELMLCFAEVSSIDDFKLVEDGIEYAIITPHDVYT